MTSAKWLTVATEEVVIAELIATQPGLYFRGLISADTEGDPYAHVVSWNGDLYLEDGHHKAARAALAGIATIQARVLRV